MIYKRIIGIFLFSICSSFIFGQTQSLSIKEMKWEKDYNLHIKLSNDTNYVVDVRALHHVGSNPFVSDSEAATYYPVNLNPDFVDFIKNRKLETENNPDEYSVRPKSPKTLWAALHTRLGGGYVHFVNCLVYSIEAQRLNLNDPIMIRPQTRWKPNPMTDTYKRTQKWTHYIPYNQKQAIKEFKIRKGENELRDLQGIPDKFIELFLSTSQKKYDQMKAEGKRLPVAQIDLVRLMLGAKYLGSAQIDFIQNSVVSAVLLYNLRTLPSVIIFDDYRAAVAMTLDKNGYKINYVVFQDQTSISSDEYVQRFDKIEALIKAINEANEKVFQKRLSSYYGS